MEEVAEKDSSLTDETNEESNRISWRLTYMIFTDCYLGPTVRNAGILPGFPAMSIYIENSIARKIFTTIETRIQEKQARDSYLILLRLD